MSCTDHPETDERSGRSASLWAQDYWWYVARGDLLRSVLVERMGQVTTMLDVGSADGPSVRWLDGFGHRVMLDIDPSGLEPGGVCGSALQLPFADSVFDVVCAFDVVEHCEPESTSLNEMVRVLKPGGRLMISVPAYQWAWTEFDEAAGHHRRYTRKRAEAAVRAAGLRVDRATYVFAGVFPFFAAERLMRRVTRRVGETKSVEQAAALPQVPRTLERLFLWLSAREAKALQRRNLPFGSSVVVAAVKR